MAAVTIVQIWCSSCHPTQRKASSGLRNQMCCRTHHNQVRAGRTAGVQIHYVGRAVRLKASSIPGVPDRECGPRVEI